MPWKVKFFQTNRGKYPVKEFFNEQKTTTQAKIIHIIRLLANNGPYLKPPYIKKIYDKLYELRISGKTAVRIFYTLSKKDEYYLLHAFKKKTDKTPSRELKTALDRMKELI